jgi:hypothetical protein
VTPEIETAWAAGLFEGEGSIMFNRVKAKGRRYASPRLQLRMTDLDIVERFHVWAGVGAIVTIANPAHIAAGRKPAWDWRTAARDDVESVLLRLEPFFGARRGAKANEALAAIAEARQLRYGQKGTPIEPMATDRRESE